jgi:hypothetical protein
METELQDNKSVTPRLTERITAARILWLKVLPSVDLPGESVFENWVDHNRTNTLHAAIRVTGRRTRLIQDNGGRMDQQWAVTFVNDLLREENRKQQSTSN